MRLGLVIGLVVVLIIASIISLVVRKKSPKKLKRDEFIRQWRAIQDYCGNKSTWPEAIMSADKLLESALKKKKFRGKNMGEKLVAAQRLFSNNDSVWFAHNLNKKLVDKPSIKLKEQDVKNALVGFRQALKDVGALPNGDPKDG